MRQVKKLRNADLLFEKKPKRISKLYGELRAFLESDSNIKELHIEDGEYSSWNSCTNALRAAIKKNNFPIWIVTRKKRVYLVRNDT